MITAGSECDQALFGWIEKKRQLGHQLISTSAGLTEGELSYLRRWNLPVSINNTSYREGIRFFQVDSGRFCLNLIKNIGKDQQGREGALMSHFIVMNRETLNLTKGDFASMNDLLLHSVSSGKDLDRLKTKEGDFYQLPKVRFRDPDTSGPDLNTLRNEMSPHTLSKILYGLLINLNFPQVRLLLVTDEPESRAKLLWAVLSILPLELRFLSYTTSLYNIRDDMPFSISLVSSVNREEYPDFSIVWLSDGSAQISQQNEAVSLLADHLASLISSGNTSKISAYSDNFRRMNTTIPGAHRLLLSLSDSYLESGATEQDKIRVALEASEIDSSKDSRFIRWLGNALARPVTGSENYAIVSTFYTDRIKNLKNDADSRNMATENMLNLMLSSPLGIDPLTSSLKELLNTLESHDAADLASVSVKKLLQSDISDGDFSKVVSSGELLLRDFVRRARNKELPKGGVSAFAGILNRLDKQKMLWQYVNDTLDDQQNNVKIADFMNTVFKDAVINVLGNDRVYKLLKRIQKMAKNLGPTESQDLLKAILTRIHSQPLSAFLTASQSAELELATIDGNAVDERPEDSTNKETKP